MESREDHALPSLSTHDLLDKSLYIRPRFKKSAPLCTILSESYQDKERHWLPVEFRKLITQFMIANRYVFKAAHLHFQTSLFESLLSRLDLHPDSNDSAEKILLKINVKRVEKFIEARSKDWQKKGYLRQRKLADGVLEVTFAKDMLQWINPNYEGKMTMPKELTTVPNQSGLEVLVDKADEEEGEEEVGDEEEPYCISTICREEVEVAAQDQPCCISTVCREEVEVAAQDVILEQNMTLSRIGSEEVEPSDEKTNSYLEREESVREAAEDMLSLQEKVDAWREKWPVQEAEDRVIYGSMIRAEANDTITALDCGSLSPLGPFGRSRIYQDGKYPATYRNMLLQQKNKGISRQHQAQPNQFDSTPPAHNPSPRANKDRMAAKNVNLAKAILEDTLTADGGAIGLRSRRQFGYVQQLLNMAQDNLPTEEGVEIEH